MWGVFLQLSLLAVFCVCAFCKSKVIVISFDSTNIADILLVSDDLIYTCLELLDKHWMDLIESCV